MSYLLLIMERGERHTWSPETRRQRYDDMMAFGERLKARGLYQASNSLRSDSDGVRVQQRDGKRLITEGPFAEAKEIVGGFFLIDCRTREEAIAIAGECPAAGWASVEVREIGPCYEG